MMILSFLELVLVGQKLLDRQIGVDVVVLDGQKILDGMNDVLFGQKHHLEQQKIVLEHLLVSQKLLDQHDDVVVVVVVGQKGLDRQIVVFVVLFLSV